MLRKLINLSSLIGAALAVWFINLRYENVELGRLFYTFLAIAVLYLVLKILLEGIAGKKIRESKARYSFRKTVQLLFVVSAIGAVIRIWVDDPQTLLVSYGLIAAGVAIALKDVFKNFAGTFAIFLGGTYNVGDRIEIDQEYGDVIDVGLFYTSLLEIRGWVNGDQATGRIILIPNGNVLSLPVHNYTKDHSFIWDEMSVPVTYDSDWKKAVENITTLVTTETSDVTKQAESEVERLQEKYFISTRNIQPKVFMTPTDNWIMLNVRYVTKVRDRRFTQNELFKKILEEIEKNPDITLASQTLSVTTRS